MRSLIASALVVLALAGVSCGGPSWTPEEIGATWVTENNAAATETVAAFLVSNLGEDGEAVAPELHERALEWTAWRYNMMPGFDDVVVATALIGLDTFALHLDDWSIVSATIHFVLEVDDGVVTDWKPMKPVFEGKRFDDAASRSKERQIAA